MVLSLLIQSCKAIDDQTIEIKESSNPKYFDVNLRNFDVHKFLQAPEKAVIRSLSAEVDGGSACKYVPMYYLDGGFNSWAKEISDIPCSLCDDEGFQIKIKYLIDGVPHEKILTETDLDPTNQRGKFCKKSKDKESEGVKKTNTLSLSEIVAIVVCVLIIVIVIAVVIIVKLRGRAGAAELNPGAVEMQPMNGFGDLHQGQENIV